MMREYELCLVVDASISAPDMDATVEKFKTLLQTHQTEILFEGDWGIRKLAYPIQKKERGRYHFFFVRSNSAALEEYKKQSGFDENVLKQIVLKVDSAEENYKKFEALKNSPEKNLEIYLNFAQDGE